jgi:hypothetical protein
MTDRRTPPISEATWQRLVQANQNAVQDGWAELGIFGPGIGPDYEPGGDCSILYVGKSAGPRGTEVGSVCDQRTSVEASTTWMIERRNRSAFWQLIDAVDPTRRSIAWTNVCKMDRKGGDRPPTGSQWRRVSEVCQSAIKEEINSLSPHTILFATSDAYRSDIEHLLHDLGYCRQALPFDDGLTSLYATQTGARAVMTRHPQGWPSEDRAKVIDLVKSA